MKKEIRFCLPVGDYWFLSHHSKFPIKMEVDGKIYEFPTVEHYYQAMKFYATDPRFNNILKMSDSNEARLLTKTPEYKNNRRENFDKNKFAIMKDAQVAKFVQNPDARKMLLSTDDAILIKSCDICYKCGFGEGSGQNIMGNILMDIRQKLQK